MVEIFIGLGANLGDREANIRSALDLLDRHNAIEVVSVSTLIETDPVGGPEGQPAFLNGAAGIDTQLPAGSLLNEMQAVEKKLGRTRGVPWGPRIIDLDLLLYGEDVIDEFNVKVPHPRMHERLFVLRPLAEIAPDFVHPVLRKTVSELLAALEGKQ
ncbi:MAG: 2-amino-4-hydroxy-6-hydroxymethyldihydropteridine diphosphokinase [Planctomycetes bacterium]|nr:2-amino-4-hydroxy-6-hydroxymethyldihydropteridine diphosphokinase [Planctomycetota bacterium]